MIQIGKSTLVIVNWRADYARSYQHAAEPAVCLTCPRTDGEAFEAGRVEHAPAYTESCKAADHVKHQIKHVTATEQAPEEAKRAARCYGRLHRAFGKLGYACGDAIYLLGADADLEGTKAKLRAEFEAVQSTFKACRIGFDLKEIVLVPGEVNEETLASIRKDVEASIQSLLTALRSGDLKQIKQAGRDVRSASAILAGDSKAQATAMADYAAGIAKRLRDAADESDQVIAEAQAEAVSGAARFAAIFADADVVEGQVAS